MAPSHARRIQGFDGIRAIAVFGVFLMHKTAIGEHYQLGQYGVWLFFLLSGFLIISQLATSRERVEAGSASVGDELGGFWWRRSLRILPPYYLLLTIMTALYLVWRRPIPGLAWHFAYLTNWYMEFKAPLGELGTWGHFWSLAIEEQFYLLAAPLIILSPRRWTAWLCLALALAGVGRRLYMVESGWPSYAIYADSLVNVTALGLGGFAALAVRTRPLRSEALGWASLTLFLSMPFLLRWLGWANDLSPLLALATGLAVILSVHGSQDGYLTRILSWRPLAYFGRISYGFYLYESYAPAQLGPRLLHHGGLVAELSGATCAFLISLVVSVASFELLERPIQQRGRGVANPPKPASAFVGAGVAAEIAPFPLASDTPSRSLTTGP